ncbi:MAG: DUF3048 domain-containing protein [Actinomycetota bacterium]|nr:DUF3048 domain-containing protein [Actinomycetota bacterium]
MTDRLLSLVLVLVVVVALTTATFPASGQETDSTLPPGGTYLDDDWNFAEGAIEALAAAGITNGCAPEYFCPGRVLIRAEAAALIARVLQPEPIDTGYYSDVDPAAWYAGDVNALSGAGIITGHTDGTFRPADPLSRAEMAQLLVRAFGNRIAEIYDAIGFGDLPPEAVYADAVDTLARGGITAGCATNPARYCPNDPVLRDQMAMFMARVLGLEMRVPLKRIAPLNGVPLQGPDWNQRVVAVKIDDHSGARPQSGVDQADAVMETLVEDDLTRWMALFHQSDSTYLGPVRSLRPTDFGLALPLSATVVVSGGQPWIVDLAVAEGVQVLRERDSGSSLFRISERKAPHNIYGDTTAIRQVADAAGYTDTPPPSLFTWGVLPEGPSATSVSLQWSDPVTVTWTWDGTRYLRSRGGGPHNWVLADGSIEQVWVETVVVLVGPVSELAVPPTVLGSPVPVIDTVGQGTALVFAQGRVVEGVWSRATTHDPFMLTTSDGSPLYLPPGTPWINVFPEGRAIGY